MTYRIEGLDPARFANVEALLSAGAIRMTVDKPGAFPCRVTLEDADLLGEVELTTNLIIAASESDEHLSEAEIDRILGVEPTSD